MKTDTLAVHAGRSPLDHRGSVSVPVDRNATRIFADLASIEHAHASGRVSAFLGSDTPDQVADAVAALEGQGLDGGACEATLTSSGMSALTSTLLAILSKGDHVLMPDNVFRVMRLVADDLLARMGIEVDYYHPLADEETLRAALKPNTRLVLTESPGSGTFEVQNIPMIAKVAHEAGILVAIDNSWATPVLFPALAHGVDISICAATKYLVGHSDAILGTVAAAPPLMERIRNTLRQLGDTPSADNAWLLARGLRTLPVRLRQHDAAARKIATALAQHPRVRRVLHPMMASNPGHEFWLRDFRGASGLFGILIDPLSREDLQKFLGRLKLFGLGFSWGGFESLILPISTDPARTFLQPLPGTLLRLHIGLEDPDDLLTDLETALAA